MIFALRTGPGDFSKLLVTDRRSGGARPTCLKVADGVLLKGDKPVPTPEEAHFFAALGLPYIPPSERTEERLRAETKWAMGMGAP